MNDMSYERPQTLRMPGVKVVYLDLNHWISLAKAMAGHPDGEAHNEILELSVKSADEGSVVFPLTATTYMELFKIGKYRQRCDLCNIIERLSGFVVVTDLGVIRTHEIEAMLDRFVGPSRRPARIMDYLDFGVSRAFGRDGRLRVYRGVEDVTDEIRSQCPDGPEAFDDFVMKAELELNRKVIKGPESHEVEDLNELGWNPSAVIEVLERRAQEELDQVARFDLNPRWRLGRIKDVITAREVIIELNSLLSVSLAARQTEIEDILDGSPKRRRTLHVMPSFDVAVTLKASYHRNPHHRWTTNDIHDIDAMAATLPYCDVVVTDSAVKSHVDRHELGTKLETVVLSNLLDLTGYL